jgi:hypothetical protein
LCNKHYLRQRIHGDPAHRFKPEGKQVCSVAGCDGFCVGKGLCGTHYMRLKRTGTTDDPRPIVQACDIPGCRRKYYGLGYCQMHYLRQRSGLDLRLARDVIEGKRQCTRCLVLHPVEAFGVSERLSGGRNIYCSSCLSDIGHSRRAAKRANRYESVSRDTVLERDSWTCHLCAEPIPPEAAWPDPLSASMDHVIPLAKGGSHTYDNVKSAHLTCNIRKGARIPA